MPYVELQKMLDEANAWGFYGYDKGCYVEELSDEVIDVLTEHFPRKTSPLSLVLFYRLDGGVLAAWPTTRPPSAAGARHASACSSSASAPCPSCCPVSATGSARWPAPCARGRR